MDVGEGFAFVWTSKKSLYFPPILISKIFVCFFMNVTTADPQTLVLAVESSAVSEQRCSWYRSCGSGLLLSHSHSVRASFEAPHSPLGHCLHCDYEQATRSHRTNFNCFRCPRQQTRQFWFWQKDISYFKMWWSKFDHVVATRCSISTWLAMQLHWIKAQKSQCCSWNGLLNMKKFLI